MQCELIAKFVINSLGWLRIKLAFSHLAYYWMYEVGMHLVKHKFKLHSNACRFQHRLSEHEAVALPVKT